MKEDNSGIVIEVVNNFAKVKIARHGDCKNCGACPGSNALIVEVENSIGSKKGDRVLVELKEVNALKAAFIVYLMPFILVFSAIGIGYLISPNTYTYQVIGGILGVIISITLIILYEKTSKYNMEKMPKIIEIYDGAVDK